MRARDSGPAIRVEGLTKAYPMYDQPLDFLKELFTGRVYHREKVVLRDVSLEIGPGEVVGIIGRNGAGKSTLLKVLAGTLSPTRGKVVVDGRVSAILELGTGFNANYSGRDNVIMSALMRGMSEAEVMAKFDSIVAFSGLEEVIDEPFHTYSSGMQARLAFAAAVSVSADIVIIDEALAAGDARFVQRSLRRIREIADSGVTALFVTHTTYQVMQLCTRAIWIDEGRVRMDGPPIEVVRAYEYDMHQAIARDEGRLRPESVESTAPLARPAVQEDAAPSIAPTPGPAPFEDTETLSAPLSPNGHTNEDGGLPAISTEPAQVEEIASPAHATSSVSGRRPDTAPEAGHAIATEVAPEPPAATAPALADTDDLPVEIRARKRRVSTGQYKITDITFLDRDGRATLAFRFGESLRLRVSYECLLPQLPDYSCGLAVAFNRVSDFEAVMYFNTNYPHSDDEIRNYEAAPFRAFRGRTGVLEAVIDPIQLKPGEYYVSLGILPNQPGMHEFYEYFHCEYRARILPNGFEEPAVFYPIVQWSNGPRELESR